MNSPIVKAFGDDRIAATESCLVVDLGGCTGMDSTFMGTLAGLATRIATQQGGLFQIAGAGDRNRRSLEDLGLDFLMEIDPPTAAWHGQEESIRNALRSPRPSGTLGQIQRARHVLEAHQNLTEMNDQNTRKFAEVVTLLQSELADKEKQAEPAPPT